ncbi:MAG: DNA replication complex subunit Gins51 [Candidatus Bathycorpusculaceae bacterium]
MYNELYEIWKGELENIELVKLPKNFYSEVVEYLKRLREESRMLDKRTVKASLLRSEMQNAKRMIRELTRLRYRKLVRKMAKGEKVSADILTVEEEKIYGDFSSFAEAYRNFVRNVLHGHLPKVEIGTKRRRVVLRFLRDVPAIIGVDMETYGPFKAEDIASLPMENAKILLKQGLAERVEVGN